MRPSRLNSLILQVRRNSYLEKKKGYLKRIQGAQNCLWQNPILLRDYVQERGSCSNQSPENTVQAALNVLGRHFQSLQSSLSNLQLLNLHHFLHRPQSRIHILKFVHAAV